MKWLWSWLKKWVRPIGAGNASTPSITTTTTARHISTESNQKRAQIKMVNLTEKKIELLRPFPADIEISSPYGERIIKGEKEFHHGYDFRTPIGTVVTACHDGAVFRAGWQDEHFHGVGFGLRVWQEIENDGKRFYIFYGHLSKIFVEEGARIHRGQEIGLSGNTGKTEGPHCHVECRLKDSKERYEIEWVEA